MSEASGVEVDLVDKGIEEADGVILGNVVVEALGEKDDFVAARTLDMTHCGTGSETARRLLSTVGSAIVHETSEF
jgi:hypothetical protein